MKTKLIRPIATALAAVTLWAFAVSAVHAGGETRYGARWTAEGKLVLPKNYHQWVFLGAPLTPNVLNNGKAGFPEYHNVYVHPDAYKMYRHSGRWPEGTVFLKELQLTLEATHADGSREEASGRGYFPGARNGIDVSVKDSRRFTDTRGWGFFNFGHHAPPYAPVADAAPKDACAACHEANATDDMVFSRFYAPVLNAQ